MGPPIPLFWTSSDVFWVSKPEWAALLMLGRGIQVTYSLRFIYGVTVADLFMARMAAKLISSTYLRAGSKLGSIVLQTNALPTELFRLGLNKTQSYN